MLSDKEKRGWDAIDEAAVQAGGYLAKPVHPLVYAQFIDLRLEAFF